MLRPPRRRKQKQQQQTGTKSQLLDSSLPNDEEYSFASSASTTDTVTSKMPSSKIAAVQKHSQKSVSSRRSAIEKENSVNHDDRCDCKASEKGNAVDRAPLRHTATRNNADADSRSSMLDPMEELSGSLNDLTLGRNSPDESATDQTMTTSTFPPIGFGASNITISVNDDGKPMRIILNALRVIEKSEEKDLVWNLLQIPAMVDAVASASWSLGPSEYMLLEENTTKMINIAKQCLKVLSSFTSINATKKSPSNTNCVSGAKDDLEMALLRVALHSLRSILPILLESENDPSKLQVALKLFYHCVVISGDACQRSFLSFAASSPRKENALKVMAYAMICLGAYEGIGKCTMPRNEKSAPCQRGTVAWDELLPAIGKDDKATTKILPHTQLVRIAMESALCASSSLLNLSLVSLRVGVHGINELWAIPDEFHFVANVIVETFSDKEQKNPMFHKLLSHVAYPYVMQSLFVSAEDGDSPNFDAGALRHVTKVFRILWDGASSVEEVCSVKNSTALRMSCFELRKDGVLFVLRALKSVFAHRQELPRENLMSICEKEVYSLFDRASLSAMKSVGIFDKAPGIIQEKKSALLHFHDNVGSALDCIAKYLCSGRLRREELPLPSSYYEYCVYRSIHQWRLIGSVRSEDMPSHLCHGKSATRTSNKEAESLVGIYTFTIIHIVLRAFHHLKMDTETMEISDSDCQQAIANFDAVVLNSMSPYSHSRCRSLLLMLDLQREATNIISTDRTDNSLSGKEKCIALLASVIGNCFAPLDAKLSLSTKDQTKCLNFCLSCADSCVKSASLFSVASDVSASMSDEYDEYSIQANTQLRKSFDMLMIEIGRMEGTNIDRKSPPLLVIETFAKAAANIGRRRFDRKKIQSSLEPQVLATEILSRVANKALDKDLFNTYQLSNRYMLLSTSLDALGCAAESIAALGMAAQCTLESLPSSSEKSHSNSQIVDFISVQMLLFPEHVVLDTEPQCSELSVALSPIIKRLFHTYIDHVKSSTEKIEDGATKPIQDSVTQSILKNTLIEEVLGFSSAAGEHRSQLRDISLSKLLDFALWNQRRGDFAMLASEKMIAVHEVLKSAIKIAKSRSLADDELVCVVKDVEDFLKTQKKRIGGIILPDSQRELISSLHVTFAGQLIESRLLYLPKPTAWVLRQNSMTKRELTLLHLACTHLELAEAQLAVGDLNQCVNHDACHFARLAAVQLLLAICSEHLSLAEVSVDTKNDSSIVPPLLKPIQSAMGKYALTLGSCSHAIDKLVASGKDAQPAVVESLLATMKRLLTWFLSRSDPTSSTECFNLLQKLYSFEVQSKSFLDSPADFCSVSARFEDLIPILLNHFDPQIFLNSDCSEIDSVMQCLTITLRSLCNSSSISTTAEMQALLCHPEACDEITSQSMDEKVDFDSILASKTNLMLHKRLLATTMLMLHAKLHIGVGRPSTAVRYLEWCRAHCRDLSNCLRSARCRISNLILDDIAIQVDDLLTSCYERLAIAFYLQGIRRKAEDFALLAVLRLKVLSIGQFGQVNMQDLIASFERHDGHECVLYLVRSLMKIKSLSSPPDRFLSIHILIDSMEWMRDIDSDNMAFSMIRLLTKSKNMLAYDESFWQVPSFRVQSNFAMSRLCKELCRYVGRDHSNALDPVTVLLKRACMELKTRIHRSVGSGLLSIDTAGEPLSYMLEEVTQSSLSTGISNSEAYYLMGLIALRESRTRGELQELWNVDTNSDKSTFCCTNEARMLFSRALTQAPPPSFILTKNILRCLALATGPEQNENGLTTASIVNISVGGASRNIVRDGIREGKVFEVFQAFDDESFDHNARVKAVNLLIQKASSLFPNNWNVSTLATCPTGELLISSIRVTLNNGGERLIECSTACIFPASTEEGSEDSRTGIHSDILIPLDRIVDRSQRQLRGITEEVQQDEYDEKSKRRQWWNERRSIDKDLECLLRHVELTYFMHDPIRQKLIPDGFVAEGERQSAPSSDDESSECSDMGPGNLESKFEAAEREYPQPIPFDKESERLKLSKLTVATIKSKLSFISGSSANTKKKNKAELIDLLLTEMESNFEMVEVASSLGNDSQSSSYDAYSPMEPCTILILDEHLLRFPFESMDMLSDIAITRVPSLPFVLATLLETENSATVPLVDPRNVTYVVDPESNLSESASTLGPALTLMASNNSWIWEGVVGKMPSTEFMSDALARENGLYLYCGHGGGEKSYSRTQVEEFMTRDDGIRGCRTPVILMGCSSGRLQSVNTPKKYSSEHDFIMHYEPDGIALSYLYAGSPCVVGNLWDVTDRDIDRYCLTLMEDFLQSNSGGSSRASSPSLAKCVANARRACKLRYIVGSAPVCYGVPVLCSKF